MLVEVLVFEGCPNGKDALDLAERLARTEFPEAEVRLVDVPDFETAQRLRFLGSPSVRVEGQDVEVSRLGEDASFSCRVYRTDKGVLGFPPEDMLRKALLAARKIP